jgi:hypothetical protein
MRVIVASANSPWPTGPYSAVRPGEHLETVQDPTESSAPEPVDEMMPGQGSGARRGPSAQAMTGHGQRSAGAALAGFPQVVHLLANPELHLGKQLSDETGLPVISLEGVAVDDLEELLAQPQFADGFILEGFPVDRASAETLDGLLSATDPGGRRVLGFDTSQTGSRQEIVEHYIDQGLLWMVPAPEQQHTSEQVKTSLLECLAGLPALE